MRIIIELDAGAAATELQITTPGKNQADNNTMMPAMSTATGIKTTDAGGPNYAAANQSTEALTVHNGSGLPESGSSGAAGASGGAAPGEEF